MLDVRLRMCSFSGQGPVSRKPRKLFGSVKPKRNLEQLRLQSCSIHIFLIWGELHFIQEVSGVYTTPFLRTDERKMALRARRVSGAFEKRSSGVIALNSLHSLTSSVFLRLCSSSSSRFLWLWLLSLRVSFLNRLNSDLEIKKKITKSPQNGKILLRNF